MRRPLLIDLFCGAGGASMGYSRAGFTVVGVDINPQPHYPFEFIQEDALTFMADWWANKALWPAAVIHASPPCQRWTRFQTSQPRRFNSHPDLITPLRPLLKATRLRYVIENVPGAPLKAPVQVCGTHFGLGVSRGQLWRHRLFEGSMPLSGAECYHSGPSVMVAGHGRDGYRGNGLDAAEAREAMRIDWMSRDEMAEAIPPIYTEWIGTQLLSAPAEVAV